MQSVRDLVSQAVDLERLAAHFEVFAGDRKVARACRQEAKELLRSARERKLALGTR